MSNDASSVDYASTNATMTQSIKSLSSFQRK